MEQNGPMELILVQEKSMNPTMTIENATIEKVMHTFGMMRRLTIEEEADIRAELKEYIEKQDETDEHRLTIAGLTYLRNNK
jgi:hypothetical protein